MEAVETGLFTIGVFEDMRWATGGLTALAKAGFSHQELSLIAKDSAAVSSLMQSTLGDEGETLDVPGIGTVRARGPLVEALQGGEQLLVTKGIAASIRLVGFQRHDGFIYETLASRGGILVAVHSAPRAADALAILMAHGGGNAAIGAWTGRV